MLSIEKAFEPFGSLNRRMGKANAQAAARALALASFDKARYQADCGNGIEDCKPDDPCGYHASRAQIGALGNESSEEVQYDRLAGKKLPVMDAGKGVEVSSPKPRPKNPPRPVGKDGSHWKRLGVKEGMNW